MSVKDFAASNKPGTTTSQKHGSAVTYRVGRCRCDECRKAHTEFCRQERLKRYAMTARGEIPASVIHGLHSTYNNWGCRCDECWHANYLRCRVYRINRKYKS